MKKRLLTLVLSLLFLGALLPTKRVYALFGVGDIVYDPAAVAQLIEQVQQMIELISTAQDIYNQLGNIEDLINNWEELDHVNIDIGQFAAFLYKYRDLFDQIMAEIEGYQNGGLFGQIDRLDEVYFSYHNGWEHQDDPGDFTHDANPLHGKLKKQILFTKIQFKHAAKVGAKIREILPESEAQIQNLLEDTAQAVGLMQTIKVGNQLTGTVAKSLQTLNLQLNEYLQAETAEGLERNNKDGLQKNRAREALQGFGEDLATDSPPPINPVGAF